MNNREIKTLIEYSYQKCKEIRYENIKEEGLERDIYYKVVILSREKIRKALRKQMGKLVLRTIYLLKTTTVSKTVEEIIGSFDTYEGSLWRLSMIHAVTSYFYSKNTNHRVLDVIDTCNTYFPCNGCEDRKEEIIEKLTKINDESDIFQYIDVYYSFGNYLFP